MATEFAADFERTLAEVSAARAALIKAVSDLAAPDLNRSVDGEWQTHRILAHVIEYERLYLLGIASIRGNPLPALSQILSEDLAVSDFVDHLRRGHSDVLAAVNDLSEEHFYREQRLGEDDFSVRGLLEKTAAHDREHTAQVIDGLGA